MISYNVLFDRKKGKRRQGKVTVIIANYNYGHYIEECLHSLLGQTLPRFQLVVIDDDSTDESRAIILDFLAKHHGRFERAALLQTSKNMGPVIARNAGMTFLKSRHYFILDADNILFPHCLMTLSEALDKSSSQFAYSISSKFGDDSDCLSFYPWEIDRLQRGNYIDGMSMIRGSWIRQVGMFVLNDCTKVGWEDYDLWIRTALEGGKGVLVPKILARYRVHGQSRSTLSALPNLRMMRSVLKKLYPDFWKLDI